MKDNPAGQQLWEQPGIPKTIDIAQTHTAETGTHVSESRIVIPPVDFWVVMGAGSLVMLLTLLIFEISTIQSYFRQKFAKKTILTKVPCKGCRYFSDNYYLKCTVHPVDVMTDRAIGCRDFCSRKTPQLSDRVLKR